MAIQMDVSVSGRAVETPNSIILLTSLSKMLNTRNVVRMTEDFDFFLNLNLYNHMWLRDNKLATAALEVFFPSPIPILQFSLFLQGVA